MQKCKQCKKSFRPKKGLRRFCSRRCIGGYAVRKACTKKRKSWYKKRKCTICKKKFFARRKEHKRCSKACSSKANANKANVAFEKKHNRSAIVRKGYRDGTRKPSGGNTKSYKYKNYIVRGTFELRACYILDFLKEKNKISNWEYTEDRIAYVDIDGLERTYFPDFKAYDSEGYYYVETKGLIRDRDYAKWLSTLQQGHRLQIWFDETLILLEKTFFDLQTKVYI